MMLPAAVKHLIIISQSFLIRFFFFTGRKNPGPVDGQTKYLKSAIEAAGPGDVIVIDNAGRPELSCWGGIRATGAAVKGISGVVIDGFCRDVDDYMELGFSVYARGPVVATARKRIVEEATNIPISFGGVLVRPGDAVLADRSGVAVIPQECFDEVLTLAESLFQKEEAMCADLKAGMSSLEVDRKYNYESMLKK